jgi:hypothetical protein
VYRYNAGQEAIEAWEAYEVDHDYAKMRKAMESAQAKNNAPF